MVNAAVYPNGVQAGSPLGVNLRIYRGHPGPDVLDADMEAGFANVSGAWTMVTPAARIVHCCVNARPGIGRSLRPYVFAPIGCQTVPPVTLTATVSGTTVTIGGAISAGQGVAVDANYSPVGVAAGSTDTIATLAASLAAAMTAAGQPATASGAVVTVPGATTLYANTFVQAVTGQEVRRQIQGFDITLYVPGRDLRDAVSAAITSSLGAVTRFTMPDGFEALLNPAPPIEVDDDKPEKDLLFVRKIYYAVEYATVLPGIAATQAIIQAGFTDTAGDTLATFVEA
jgi:hypothetical protein